MQDSVEKLKYEEVIEIAKDRTSKGRLDAVLYLGDRPGELQYHGATVGRVSDRPTRTHPICRGNLIGKIGETAAPHLKELLESDDRKKQSGRYGNQGNWSRCQNVSADRERVADQ